MDKTNITLFNLYNINSLSYEVQEHTVETEDGYKLEIFRIIGKCNQITIERKQAVFFQHGLLDSCDAWICNYEKYSLPFIMTNKGFDVVI